MFGARCSLCNGKLDSKNVCKECGLDNTKSDKYYKINQSSCDDMPLTHVHEEPHTEKKQKRKKTDYSYQKNATRSNAKTNSCTFVMQVRTSLSLWTSRTHTTATRTPYTILKERNIP